jgi:hypothetical protein
MQKLTTHKPIHLITACVVVVVASIGIGTYSLLLSHAATPYASVKAQSGSLSGVATSETATSASGEAYVLFSSTISPTPSGPAIPASGWTVDLADDFNNPLGTGADEDNLWYPTQSWNNTPTTSVNGDNADETEVYNSSQVSVSGGNLVLTAKYQNNAATAVGDGDGTGSNNVQRNYVSGIVTTPTTQSGYKGFNLTFGDDSTWAFEIDCQWPPNTGELWDAFATNSPSTWVNERDFFEGKSSPSYIDTDWIYSTPNTGGKKQDFYSQTLGFDPAAAMHRYTYVVYPDSSWSLYIDGVLQTWVGTNGIAPIETTDNTPLEVAIDYALSATTTGFSTGSRQFLINSVAVYQDTANAGKDTTGGGVAPGTIVGNNSN